MFRNYNRTQIIVAIFGIVFAVAGITHGVFEILQAPAPKPGLFVDSIGPEQRFWPEGDDPGISILPTFLLSGVFTVGFGVLIIAQCLFGLSLARAAWIFLSLFIAQTLTGGGLGYVPFYLVAWGYLTRVEKPLDWVGPKLDGALGRLLAVLSWPAALIGAALWLQALIVSVIGIYPGLTAPQDKLMLIWLSLLGCFILMNIALLGALARDRRD